MTMSLVIDSINDETPRVRSFILGTSENSPLPIYTAGAHIDIDLGELGTRSYSLIDWPGQGADTEAKYAIAVQLEEDGTGGSQAMHGLSVGQKLNVSVPKNNFELHPANGKTLLLAGGIGVTPMISMASKLASDKLAFEFHYTGRSQSAMAFGDKITSLFPEQSKLHFDDGIPLDLTTLMASQEPNTNLYICGPKGMIDAAKAEAIANGFAEENIYIELFTSPETSFADKAFEVEIHESGDVFTIPADRTIIEVLEEAGMDLMFDCQRGDCGICQTDVISGDPDHRDVVLSEADRASGKVMQICVSRAKSDRLVLDI